MKIRILCAVAALSAAGASSAQVLHTNPHFLGFDMRIDHSATASAQALGGDLDDALVYRMFAQFSSLGSGGNPYVVLEILHANFGASSGSLYQDPFGGDLAPNSSLFPLVPSLRFDSYVSIGAVTDPPGSISTGGEFAWGSAGVDSGGWRNGDNTNPVGQSSFNPGRGVWETFLGQFTLVDIDAGARDLAGPSANRDGRWFGQATITFFTGQGTQGYFIFDQGFVPSPGGVAALCLLGLGGARRRR